MLKDGILTSMHEFVTVSNGFNDLTRWAWTEYGILYDGSNEVRNDIAILIGGFPYGVIGDKLRIVNTIMVAQGRPPEDCIDEIGIGDWIILACGKIFGADELYIQRSKQEIPFNKDRFEAYYGDVGSAWIP